MRSADNDDLNHSPDIHENKTFTGHSAVLYIAPHHESCRAMCGRTATLSSPISSSSSTSSWHEDDVEDEDDIRMELARLLHKNQTPFQTLPSNCSHRPVHLPDLHRTTARRGPTSQPYTTDAAFATCSPCSQKSTMQ